MGEISPKSINNRLLSGSGSLFDNSVKIQIYVKSAVYHSLSITRRAREMASLCHYLTLTIAPGGT